ncbi:MAG: membrane protein insertase YidC [Ignavibacteria bacterium]|nr:membrane protein insertase YidC [Ignavibacteria bacterium]
MDKRSVLAFVIIGIILVGWLIYSSQVQQKKLEEQKRQQYLSDSIFKLTDTVKKSVEKDTVKITEKVKRDTISSAATDSADNYLKNTLGSVFYKYSYKLNDSDKFPEKNIFIKNGLSNLQFTNYGAAMMRFYPVEFKQWNGEPVQLVDWKKKKELSLLFTSKDGKLIDTRDLYFNCNYNPEDTVDILTDKDFKLRYELILSEDSTQKITITYSFIPDSYEFDVLYSLQNSNKFINDNKYQVLWSSSLNLTEYRSDDESNYSEAYAYSGTEFLDFDVTTPNDTAKSYFGEKKDINGTTDYVSSRNKYFGVFLIPFSRKSDGAYLEGNKILLPDKGFKENYSIALKMDIRNDKIDTADFKILLAPMDYKILSSYNMDLEKTMRFPLDFIVRPIAIYVILPFFYFLHSFIPNYGLVIIVFAIAMKILLNPLMKKQMESMKKMGQLNPKMTEIREKYKDDPSKQNQAIMELYRKEKINPAGGCLPMLIQLPILYALFRVFSSTIELRQQPFIWWIKDLSVPDVIFTLPFKIPLFGIDQIAGLATLMGITMFIQQKMTTVDPKQKMLTYMMPIMFTLLFYTLPSGLNLYYFMFNLLSIAQQYYQTKIKKPLPELPEAAKMTTQTTRPRTIKEAKKSFWDRMSDMQKKYKK